MSNKDNFDTTYRKVKGFHIIGYDAETDTFSKLHIDQNGHIYAKLVADKDGTKQELALNRDGLLRVIDLDSKRDIVDVLEKVVTELRVISNILNEGMNTKEDLETLRNDEIE